MVRAHELTKCISVIFFFVFRSVVGIFRGIPFDTHRHSLFSHEAFICECTMSNHIALPTNPCSSRAFIFCHWNDCELCVTVWLCVKTHSAQSNFTENWYALANHLLNNLLFNSNRLCIFLFVCLFVFSFILDWNPNSLTKSLKGVQFTHLCTECSDRKRNIQKQIFHQTKNYFGRIPLVCSDRKSGMFPNGSYNQNS